METITGKLFNKKKKNIIKLDINIKAKIVVRTPTLIAPKLPLMLTA